jgi:hypothetical protein
MTAGVLSDLIAANRTLLEEIRMRQIRHASARGTDTVDKQGQR